MSITCMAFSIYILDALEDFIIIQAGHMINLTNSLTQIAKGVSAAVQSAQLSTNTLTVAVNDDSCDASFTEDFYSREMPKVGSTDVQNFELVKAALLELKKPVADDLQALYSFNGFGCIRNIFDETASNHLKRRDYLKAALTSEEYTQAKEATLTSFYTPTCIPNAIWDGLTSLEHFDGARITDPAVGTGRLIAPLSNDLKASCDLTLIELDTTSHKIAEALYPNADVIKSEFQDIKLDLQDFIITNPPFNSARTSDRTGLKINAHKLHTFFLLKSLLSLREGGILSVILPTTFMDNHKSGERLEVSLLGDLVGAVRVPFELFEKHSATKMAVDVLTFKRLDNPTANPAWIDTIESSIGGSYYHYNAQLETTFINLSEPVEEFLFNKKSVLWKAVDNTDLEKQVYDAVLSTHSQLDYKKYTHSSLVELSGVVLEDTDSDMPYTYNITTQSDLVFQTAYGFESVDACVGGTKYNRIKGLIAIGIIANKLFDEEAKLNADQDTLDSLRASLNTAYDAFVKKLGFISSRANRLAFKRDARYASLLALESSYDAGVSKAQVKSNGGTYKAPSAEKALIFEKRAFTPWVIPTRAKNPKDALDLSLAFTGKVDFTLISELLNVTEKEAISKLLGVHVFYNPKLRGYELSDSYLCGDVKTKLALAKSREPRDSRMAVNIVELEKVQPRYMNLGDINYSLTSHWLPKGVITSYLTEKLGFKDSTDVNHLLGAWKPKLIGNGSQLAMVEYSTPTHNLRQVLALIFSHGDVVVRIYDDGKVVGIDQDATGELKQVVRAIALDFMTYVETCSDQVEAAYNEKVNRFAPFMRNYINNNYPDLSKDFKPYNHQSAAISRVISNTDNGLLLDMAIGSGKSATYIISAVQMVKIGLKNRILICCPNHLVAQTASEFIRLYPSARNSLLVLNSKSMSPRTRLETLNRIKTSNINYVICPFSTSVKISPPLESVESEITARLNELDLMLTLDDSRSTVREIENAKKVLKESLHAVSKKYDPETCFQALGFDGFFLDEAQAAKNSGYNSSVLRGVKGVGTANPSQFALDCGFKTAFLIKEYTNPGVVFGTGTSLSNSLVEIYGYMRMLAPNISKAAGIHTLNDFATTFVSIDSTYEVRADGSIALTRRAKTFNNLEELAAIFSSFSFTVTSEQLQGLLPAIIDPKGDKHCAIVPMSDNKPESHTSETTDETAEYMDTLVARAKCYKSSPIENDNALLLISDARKASVSPMMVDALSTEVFSNKTKAMIENITTIYQQGHNDKSVQLCFVDCGTPSNQKDLAEAYADQLRRKANMGCNDSLAELKSMRGVSVNLYKHIKIALVANGISQNEIAYAQDFDSDVKKLQLYDDLNSGKIRIVLSTFAKLSTGANIQQRIKAIHVLAPPLTPSALSQGIGRGIRQGHLLYNQYLMAMKSFSVDVILYSQKNSVDSWLYQLLEAKTQTISAFRAGTLQGVRMLNLESDAITFGEIKALVSGRHSLIELLQIDRLLFDLESQYRGFLNKKSYTRNAINLINNRIDNNENVIKDANSDVSDLALDAKNGNLKISIGDQEFNSITQMLADVVFGRYAEARQTYKFSGLENFVELCTIGRFQIITVQGGHNNAVYVQGPSGRHYYLSKGCHNKKMLAEAIRVMQSLNHTAASLVEKIQSDKEDLDKMNNILTMEFDLSEIKALELKKIQLVKVIENESKGTSDDVVATQSAA